MASIWRESVEARQYPTLKEDRSTGVVVIGGGMAGILTAFHLQKRGIETILLEADRIGGGQTKNTTAKITSQHNLIYHKLIEQFGEEKARQYALANEQGIKSYRKIIQEQKIDCFFEERPAYLYSQNKEDIKQLKEETQAAVSAGIEAEFVQETELPFFVAGAVKFHGQAQFHPLKFLYVLANELEIFEHTRVMTVKDHQVYSEQAVVTADSIVFATHFPFLNLPGLYFARMHQERSYALALRNATKLEGMYLGIDEDALSLRNFEETLLFGGGSHRTGENTKGGKYQFLRTKAKEMFPQSKEILHWSAQDCMTLDGVPYIGQFSRSVPHWYVATGFGKWGMTGSMTAAEILANQITGNQHPCAEVFSPLRFTPAASAKTFCTHMQKSVKGIARRIFSSPTKDFERLAEGHGGIVELHGQKIGAYKDEESNVYTVSVRCPHLGCQLEWNPDEKSWDCPCHGSRFDYQGKLLDNPAQIDLKGNNDGKD